MKSWLFYLGLFCFAGHEIDVMIHDIWFVIPPAIWIPEEYAQTLFVLAHLLLFITMMFMLPTYFLSKFEKVQTGMALFVVIHGILHSAFMTHEHYEFDSFFSSILIFGGTLFCAVFLIFQSGLKQGVTASK